MNADEHPDSDSIPPADHDGGPEAAVVGAPDDDDGPGWMPAILAGLVLSGILGFLFCGFSTWLLFQRRAELATRTIQNAYLPQLKGSRLAPETKGPVVDRVAQLGNDLAGGKYDNAQASAILQRLQRIPVLQWGELQAVERFYVTQSDADAERLDQVHRDVTRLFRGVEMGKVTSFDFHEILLPALEEAPKESTGFRLKEPMSVAAAESVFERVTLSANDHGVPDQVFEGVSLDGIVAEAIESGATEGAF